jgi:hypothetical protein
MRPQPPPLRSSAAYNFASLPATQATPIPSESMLFGRHFGLGLGLSGRDLVESSADVPQARSPLLSASAPYTSTNSHPIRQLIILSENMHFGHHFGIAFALSGRNLVEMSADPPACAPLPLSSSAVYTSTNLHPILPLLIR